MLSPRAGPVALARRAERGRAIYFLAGQRCERGVYPRAGLAIRAGYFLNILPTILLLGEPLGKSVLGATGNVAEALLAWWILVRLARFDGGFAPMRAAASLVLVSLIAPVISSLIVPAWLVLNGVYASGDFGKMVLNWKLANACGILVLVPFLLALRRGEWSFSRHRWEALFGVLVRLDRAFHSSRVHARCFIG